MTADGGKSRNFSVPDNVLKPLFVASNCLTLNEALKCLIETAKTSDGRLDLASKHILVPLLELCRSPPQLLGPELLLSIKLLRNLCAGEIKNQDLLVEQNGVEILSTLIGYVTSSSENGILRIVLQLLGNVLLAGERHCCVVWHQFFPVQFLDIAGVRSKEICDPLCMAIYTCMKGSKQRTIELLTDPGLDIIVEIMRTVTVAGFNEEWMRLLLSKTCLEESCFWPVFSKLSPVAESKDFNDNISQTNHYGAEQAFLLSFLAEILNEHVGDIVVSNEFSSCIFGILRNVVGILDFSTKGTSSLPTGSPNIDVLGYTLAILRDISAFDCPKVSNENEQHDTVDMLVSAGLIKFLISLLRDLEPPAIIRKAMTQNEAENRTNIQPYRSCPYKGFRRDIVAIIGNCSYHKKHVQDEIRQQDGILLLLQQCVTDEDNPFLREWGIWSIRNILEGNSENQQLVADLELQRSVDVPEIAGLGLRVEVDPKTRRPKLINTK